MTQALLFVEPGSESADFMQQSIGKTFEALRKHQDPKHGIWHLVINEPDTRVESTASSAIVYCYDRLRELDRVDRRHQPMIERAFEGLKRLYYRGGTAAACRGTGSGPPQYYRTRPMGYFEMSLFSGMGPKNGQRRRTRARRKSVKNWNRAGECRAQPSSLSATEPALTGGYYLPGLAPFGLCQL
jgi:hypothetical protein